ncbi:cytochrome P450 [Allokutzneria sp. NRRL B-24872]|uniref:cytochrome P450 n=1 Tax=Allokutzneria sp. NRRL B-24872 TaxID=1137961 RepID=UPI000A38DFA2|nr:cytochrome P450 [Allokutzneria sp. NRRL B-24872]
MTDRAETLEFYRQMRAEAPVHFDADTGAWLVFSHDAASTVMSDHKTFSSDFSGVAEVQDELNADEDLATLGNHFGWTDPPVHRRLRGLVSKAFTARMVARMEPRVTDIATELLDRIGDRADFDFITDFAHPLPVVVIAEMLGVPAADRDRFKKWSDALLEQPDREDGVEADTAALKEMVAYLRAHIRARAGTPTDDLTTQLIQAEIDGERLSENQIIGTLGVLMMAGHITTTTLLGNAVLCFDEHPEVLRRVRDDPSLLPATIEEVLRYRTSFERAARLVKQDTTLGGQELKTGQLVLVLIDSANRDERHGCPATFDIDRPQNQHLSFGHGIHFCLGAPLARLEARIALELLLKRYSALSVLDASFYEAHSMVVPHHMPVRVRP